MNGSRKTSKGSPNIWRALFLFVKLESVLFRRAFPAMPSDGSRRSVRVSRAIALDVSNNNPAGLTSVLNSGAVLLICKATEGLWFQDETLAAHRAVAKKLKIRFGSYMFLHGNAGGANQAKYYVDYARPRPGELVIVDSEEGGQLGATIEEMAARTHEALVYLKLHGAHPILYASSSYWTQLIRYSPALRTYPVWEAQYPKGISRWFPGLGALRTRLRHGVTTVLWQFSAAYQVGNRKYDASLILERNLL